MIWIKTLDDMLVLPWQNSYDEITQDGTRCVGRANNRHRWIIHRIESAAHSENIQALEQQMGCPLPEELKELLSYSSSIRIYFGRMTLGLPGLNLGSLEYPSLTGDNARYQFLKKRHHVEGYALSLCIGTSLGVRSESSYIVIDLQSGRVAETYDQTDMRRAREWPSLSEFLLTEIAQLNVKYVGHEDALLL